MRAASPALIAFLQNNKSFRMVDVYDIDLIGGYSAYYTDADFDVVFNGITYLSKQLIIERDTTKTVIGTQVDTLNLKITAKPDSLLNGSSWLSAVRNGALDGARVKLRKVFMPSWGDTTTLGGIILFTGLVADVPMVGRFNAELNINSDLQFLNINMPSDMCQAGCRNVLYGYGCVLIKSQWGTTAQVLASSLAQVTCRNGATDSYYSLGVIQFNNGPNAGIQHSIKDWRAGTALLALPLLTPCNPGDSVTLFPGCDKKRNTCKDKFNNLTNFRAEPYVPVPETVG